MNNFIVGNDVSAIGQGSINFDIYKNNSNFIICKASEGTLFKDPQLDRNKSEARRVGLPLGFYHFARPETGNSPDQEADNFIHAIGELKEGEVLALDFEVTYFNAVDWCKKWLDIVASKTNGTKPLIYMDQSRVKGYDWKPIIDAGYGLWLASYQADGVGDIGKWPFMAMQQTSSTQKVPGINGNVDRNIFFGDAAIFKKYGFKPSIPVPPVPSIGWKAKYEAEAKAHDADNKAKDNTISTLNTSISQLMDKINKAKQALN